MPGLCLGCVWLYLAVPGLCLGDMRFRDEIRIYEIPMRDTDERYRDERYGDERYRDEIPI